LRVVSFFRREIQPFLSHHRLSARKSTFCLSWVVAWALVAFSKTAYTRATVYKWDASRCSTNKHGVAYSGLALYCANGDDHHGFGVNAHLIFPTAHPWMGRPQNVTAIAVCS
jgi:hypothetical protein